MAAARLGWRRLGRRLAGALVLGLAETAVVLALTTATTGPAATQVFDDRFPFIEERARRGGPDRGGFFGNDARQGPAIESNAKAPQPARKPDPASPALTTVVVLGDSMSDWLAYGLEQAAADSPDIGIIRRSRTYSGLIRLDVKNDPRGEYPDWPVAARDMLNADKPNFIVVMLGLNDRRAIREKAEKPEKNAAKTTGPAAAPAAPQAAPGEADREREKDTEDTADEPAVTEPQRATPGMVTYEFRSDKWVELYTKRIDEMMATLKAKNVPVFWVGLPPIRSPKAAEDVSFLNDLYRGRAEKAGITYIDTWDGFVDDAGRFVMQGPDFEGQIRRLRSNDGVHFTQSGARKLAHYVEREIQRSLMTHATPVALPIPDEPAPQAAAPARPGTTAIARPLAGPVMPLTSAAEADELLGGARNTRDGVADPSATKVLVKGDQASAPAGRADDFAWPRRGVAPLGTDPLVATTTTPMTPMINPQEQRQVAAAPAATSNGPGQPLHRPPAAARQAQGQPAQSQGLFGAPRPPTAVAQRQQDQRRFFQPSQPSFFFPFFGR